MSANDIHYNKKGYRHYVLFVLTFTYAVNFIDRQILVILQEPIKQELGINDTQLGLLTGIAFAAVFVITGIPVARLADRWVRRNVISISVATWSVFTALSGLSQHYGHLLLARMGVGAAESGCNPPAHSMIADIFPPRQRATALSVYSTGINIGILLGFVLGGWINEFFGWRVALIAVGIPGIALAALIQVSVKEPARGRFDPHLVSSEDPGSPDSLTEGLCKIWHSTTLRHLVFGSACISLISYGNVIWFAPHMLRNFDISTGELGTWLALLSGVLGGISTVLGGLLADRLGKTDPRWYLRISIIAIFCSVLPLPIVYTANNVYLALSLYALPAAFATVFIGPSLSVLQALASPAHRALASACFIFVINIFGLGLGPVLVGIVSDLLTAQFASQSVGYAVIAIAALFGLLGIWHFYVASGQIRAAFAKIAA